MGIFKKMAGVVPSGQSNYLSEGTYLVEIRGLTFRESQKDKDSMIFVLEFNIVHSTSADHPEGSIRSHTIMLPPTGQKLEMGLGNIKNALMAILEKDASEITEDVCEAICAKPDPLIGALVVIDVNEKPTREGGVFSAHNYHTATDDETARVRKLCGLPLAEGEEKSSAA